MEPLSSLFCNLARFCQIIVPAQVVADSVGAHLDYPLPSILVPVNTSDATLASHMCTLAILHVSSMGSDSEITLSAVCGVVVDVIHHQAIRRIHY